MKNPYSLLFGKEPVEQISRLAQTVSITESFDGASSDQQIYLITGVRGSGKTVFMTNIQNHFRHDPNWIVAELNPEKDILTSLAAKLSSEQPLAQLFKTAKINLSFWGLGLEVNGIAPITDIEVAVSRMLEVIKKQRKKVLITIDEVTSNRFIREFAASYQILIRQNLPLYLLMTGLYENINNIQNERSLTFLYRAPRINLTPLNITAIAQNYAKTLNISHETAMQMALLTRGYSFAFQVLGYFAWEHKGDYTEILPDVRQYLDEYVYDKIWSELSPKDKAVLYGISQVPTGKIDDIRAYLKLTSNEFNPYRKRLINKGVINGENRGLIKFTLPMFEDYVIENMMG